MKKIFYIVALALVLLGFWTGFYFKQDFLNLYGNISKGLESIQKTDFQNLANEAAKQFFAPEPLQIGRSENKAILTSAKVIAQTNVQRYDNGQLPPLVENANLNAAARAKAEDILKNQYFEHVSLSGVDPGQLVKSFGYEYIVSGENLILGNFADEKEVVQDWMDSPGHRANILNDRFTDIGVAMVKGTYQGRTVWVGVQEFGLPIGACQSPDAALKIEIDDNKNQLNEMSLQIESKRQEIENTSRRDPKYNTLINQYNQLVEKYNSLANTTKNLISQYNIQLNNFNQCVVG